MAGVDTPRTKPEDEAPDAADEAGTGAGGSPTQGRPELGSGAIAPDDLNAENDDGAG
ncbi:hypothetical protein GCM10008171_05610 [Methylopila jiangsuensis]|uniref:Uncharacterized protein n=1 Tax=Methylopila jiangsuensis TaxID=586230 RepID=A0A9W6JE41_9HYPH|nr:hypothetical protein [Methylopila jiangsuensis]MDR6285549.1 hypothetical protein [Methylopila jiangsuensis]GLK75307.1 hypothetical protein GCM10008171_05610 [Methylopila jiangsuensis]